MRKTLTIVAIVFAAGSIAACKPFWEKEPPTAPTATVAETTTPEVSKPPEETASMSASKPAATYGEKTETPPAPAKK